MNTTDPTMTNLFLQLGLDASEQAIAQFIKGHPLEAGVAIAEAPYWNAAQKDFLAEQLKDDAAWAMIVDQLSEALHEDAVRRRVAAKTH